MVDSSSEGPGYIFFDSHWWRVDVGATAFIPKGYPHAWSSGNNNGFKMLCMGVHAKRQAEPGEKTLRLPGPSPLRRKGMPAGGHHNKPDVFLVSLASLRNTLAKSGIPA